MKTISKAKLEELKSKGAVTFSPREQERMNKQIILELIRGLASIEDSVMAVEDTILSELGKRKEPEVKETKKVKFEFKVERDSNGLIKKITAMEE